MPSIIISRDSHFEQVFALEGHTRIGRSPANDVVLDAAGVSRNHAVIEQEEDRFFLVDEGSTNGTIIKGQRVRRHLLTDGTSFRIQSYLLTYVDDAGDPGASDQDLGSVTLMGNAQDKMLETVWQTQSAARETGLQEKIFRLLTMVSDLVTASADADAGALVLEALFEITGAKRGIVALKNKGADPTFTHLWGFDQQARGPKVSRSIFQKALDGNTAVFLRCADREDPTETIYEYGLKSVICAPLVTGGNTIGCIYLDNPDVAGAFSETDRDLLVAAAEHIAESFLPDKRQAGGLTGDDERLSRELSRQGIIARSPKTLKVFRDSQTIARFNISALIFGETGTGKEILARYIHEHSGRPGKFIARNCSAIAASMFESELFGHQKGAFTGATEQKPGIFELADGGTLFLDEIGDMPAELQAKVLRALQEQEIWRVGGKAPIKIDVRIIAATHKDIKAHRQQLNFRDDLYYRLANVEITAPSLRERPEDIAPLCAIILETFSRENQRERKSPALSPKALRLLEAYDWPGNIRELRNTMIQILLKCDGATIEPRHLKGLIDVYAVPQKADEGPLPTLEEVERAHILKALKVTDGNKSAAAKLLDMDRNRLHRRLKSLGIGSPDEQ